MFAFETKGRRWLRPCPGTPVVALAILGLGVTWAEAAEPPRPCKIEVVERGSGWPVPLIELRTNHHQRYVSDNAGLIAIDDPSLMHREVWFGVHGHGYQVPADGFGFRGVRLTPVPGTTLRVEVDRASIAKRLGRLTGSGLFAESQQLGEELAWTDGPVLGCDSLQLAVHNERALWMWGDTTIARYPLGVFHMSGATTPLDVFASLIPPIRPRFEYITDDQGSSKGLAPMPGKGPTWLTGVVSLPEVSAGMRLVAVYRKITPPLSVYEIGQCVWSDKAQAFEHHRTLWHLDPDEPAATSPSAAAQASEPPAVLAEGHPVFWQAESGQTWLMFGNPFPHVRLPATYAAWDDVSQWEQLTPQSKLEPAEGGTPIEPHSGSIAYNAFRQRWVAVFVQKFGKESFLGTVWYAEADKPTGPWGPAVKILAHDNYSFYNPRLHPELTVSDDRVLLFEGTFTATFAQQAQPTPRWDYNQVLYRLDLDDPRLRAAQ